MKTITKEQTNPIVFISHSNGSAGMKTMSIDLIEECLVVRVYRPGLRIDPFKTKNFSEAIKEYNRFDF